MDHCACVCAGACAEEVGASANLGSSVGAVVPAGRLLDWIFIRGHAVVVGLVVVLALAAVATVYSLQDQLHTLCGRRHLKKTYSGQ